MYNDDDNYRRAIAESLLTYRCRHCDSVNVLHPAFGGRRVLSVTHEPGCPNHGDFDGDAV